MHLDKTTDLLAQAYIQLLAAENYPGRLDNQHVLINLRETIAEATRLPNELIQNAGESQGAIVRQIAQGSANALTENPLRHLQEPTVESRLGITEDHIAQHDFQTGYW